MPVRENILRVYGFGGRERMTESSVIQQHLEQALQKIGARECANTIVRDSRNTGGALEFESRTIRDAVLARFRSLPPSDPGRSFQGQEIIWVCDKPVEARRRGALFHEAVEKLRRCLPGLSIEGQASRKLVTCGNLVVGHLPFDGSAFCVDWGKIGSIVGEQRATELRAQW